MSGSVVLLAKRKFNPRTLFANNEQGLWLDPSDMTAGKAAWRRNLLLNTEALSLSPWTADGATFSANTTVAPNGTTTAGTFTGASGNYRIYQQRTSVVGESHTISLYVKQGTSPTVQIDYINVNNGPVFTFATESFSSIGGFTTNVQNVGSGWYRLLVTATNINSNPGPGFRASGATTFFIWGVQYEQSSTPTDYQPITDFSTEFKQAFPTHTLYQSYSSDAVPCTAAGDPVGLIIDQSRGGLASLGPEIVTNGGLSDATDWTVSGASPPSITGGQAVWSASTGEIQWASSLTVGKWYKLELDLVSYTSGNLNFRDGTTNTSIATTGTVAGRKTFLINATATQIRFISFGSATLVIDNISVREVPGNHAYQTTSASRPTLARIPSSGRRNLLTYSEQFDVATGGWQKGSITITANTDIAPDGTSSGDTITTTVGGANPNASQTVSYVTGQQYTFSVYLKAGSSTSCVLNTWGPGVGVFAQQTFTGLGSSWTRCVFTFTSTVTSASAIISISPEGFTTGTGKTLIAWGAQLETGSTATSYQKVVASTDVTESGGVSDLWHLVFDGSDDSLVTNSVDFTSVTEGPTRNLVRSSENFSAPWTANGVASATYNNLGPEGRFNATTFTVLAQGGQTHIQTGFNYTPSQTHVFTFWMKAGTANTAAIGFYAGAGFLSQTGAVLSGPGTISGTTLQSILSLSASEWTKFQITFTAPASGVLELYFYGETSGVKTGLSQSMAQFQLEVGSTPTAYQPTGTDEMTVIAGVRKLSDAASAVVVEASADANANNGAFAVYGPRTANPTVDYRSRGTLTVSVTEGSSSASPITLVFTGQSDISGDSVTVRKNGVEAGSSTGDQGTGNYGNYQLFIGRRNQTFLSFTGHIYQLIVRGKTTPTGKLLEAERYTARKTGTALASAAPFSPLAVVLTTGSSYTIPAGATSMKVWAIGGGGTWSHYCDSQNGGTAGGAGAVAVRTYSVTGGQSVTYSIGSGTIGGGTSYSSCDATNVFAGSTTVTYSAVSVSGNGGRTHRDGPTTNGTCTNATTCGVAGNDVDGLNAAVTLAGGSVTGRGIAGTGSSSAQPGNGGNGAIVLYFT